ncbi:MAG TPA: DUF4388 domain-containing protein [Thermoanaerobaculia bacterium]|nr:DUF4388 domain-containing protein [Thermoanaerobaculia bacterium]
MGITGNLRTMALSELLQWLSLGGKNGTLLVEGHGVEKRIYFQNGRVASSSSSDQREYLGHFLVAHGYITEDELKMAMEVQEESSILLGKILVMINAISETDLLKLMRKKAEESIYDVFLWEEGDFEFLDNEMPDQKMVPLALDVTGIILEGLRRYDEWKRIRETLPTMGVVPRIVRPLAFDRLTDQQKLVVPYLNGQRSIEEIAVQTHNSEFVVAKMIYAGIRDGTMAVHQRSIGVEAPATAPRDRSAEIEQLLRRGKEALSSDPEGAWKLFRSAAEIDPSDGRPREAMRDAENRLRSRLAAGGVELHRVPLLKVPLDRLTSFNFTPNEGFVLSRINGSWDVKSIIKISPIREIEVLLVFQRLLRDGVIEWRRPEPLAATPPDFR